MLVECMPGTGGGEAALFALEIADAVAAWARLNGIRAAPAAGGTRVARVDLPGVPAVRLAFLAGVHRMQRVPPGTARNRRRQTAYVTVAVLEDPSAPAARTLGRGEVRVTVARGSGPGGQHRNTSNTAVTVAHRATGLAASVNQGRKQSENLRAARATLSRRLAERDGVAAAAELNGQRRAASQGGTAFDFGWNAMRDEVAHPASGRKWRIRAFAQGRF